MFARSPGHHVLLSALVLIVAFGAGGCNQRHWVCEPPDEAALAKLPERLSETGLYSDFATETLSAGTRAYQPEFELWSDGASKRRWLLLPAGARIDTSDMDTWIFPEGTQLWKEFVRDGVRVETRLLQKVGPREQDWIGLAYVWAADQHEAYAAPQGAIDVLGTRHNVPASGECMACHAGSRSRVLGVSAIQLSRAAQGDDLDLERLRSRDLLSHPPVQPLIVPGDETVRAALGYLHANCSHCHNRDRPRSTGARCYEPDNELDFRLLTNELETVERTPTYQTMGSVVKAGRPGASPLVRAVSTRDFFERMPPLASERTNSQAVALLRRWIAGL
jgi:hypothetical protein